MATNDTKGVALVAGGSGIVGHSVAMGIERAGKPLVPDNTLITKTPRKAGL